MTRSINILCFILASMMLPGVNIAQALAGEAVPGRYILKLQPEFRHLYDEGSIDDMSFMVVAERIGTDLITRTLPRASRPEYPYDERGRELVDLSLWLTLTCSGSLPDDKAISLLMGTGLFSHITREWIPALMYTPDDPLVGNQYYLDSVKAYQAWEISKGDTSIVIGIVDTGIQNGLTDLEDDIQKNWNDPIDGIDNDLDGYIDNFRGWDIANDDNNASSFGNHHGVYVAGPAGAETDNTYGIAGVGFNTRLLPVKIMHQPSYQLINSYAGIVYAADHGADIINCSWGRVSGAPSPYEQDVINYATINKGAVVVAAAGNWNNILDVWPASYDNVLSVAGTTVDDVKMGASNWGINVDISAPGKDIYVTADGNAFGYASGTSFAAPIVSGIAALVKDVFPQYDATQIAQQVRVTADSIYQYAGNIDYEFLLGKGRANALRALSVDTLPSVRMVSDSVYDGNNEHPGNGDTVLLSGTFVNYLYTVQGLSITLRSLSPYIQLIDSVYTVSGLGTYDTTENHARPFRMHILPGAPLDQDQYLVLLYRASGYTDHQALRIPVNRLRADFVNRALAVSVFTNGRTGFSDGGQTNGLGWKYKKHPLSAMTSFMIGLRDTVSDAAYDNPAGTYEDDFRSQSLAVSIPGMLGDWQSEGLFDDSLSGNPIGLRIRERTHGFRFGTEENILIREYIVYNERGVAVDSLFAGIFSDIDILNYDQNIGSYDSLNQVASIRAGSDSVRAGLLLLSGDSVRCYMIRNDGGNGSINIYDGLTTAEKFTVLSSHRHATDTQDVSMVLSTALPSIGAGDSVTIAFALIVAGTQTELIDLAGRARDIYFRDNWLGYSSDWHITGNWSSGSVPGDTTFVRIPSNPVGGNFPVISAGAVTAQLWVDSSASLEIDAGIILDVKQSLHNGGDMSFGSGIVRFSGTGEQSARGPSGISVGSFWIDNQGGSLHLMADVTLSDSLYLVDGLVDLHHATVTLSSTASLVGENDSNRLSATGLHGEFGLGSGLIRTIRSLNSPSDLDVAGLGLVMNSSVNFGNTLIERGHSVLAGSGICDTVRSVCRYYRVVPTMNGPADVAFSVHSGELNGHDTASLSLFFKHEGQYRWSRAAGSMANYVFTSSVDSFSTLTLADSARPLAVYAEVAATMILAGAYEPGPGYMRDDLRVAGLIPQLQPYASLPGFGYEGNDSVSAIVLAQLAPRAVVDWVLLDLRDASAPTNILATRAGLLWTDGLVTDTDGRSAVRFEDIFSSTYYIGVRHRNHLGLMTDAVVELDYDSLMIDFTDSSIHVLGLNSRKLFGAVTALWPGNANGDASVIYAGTGSDPAAVFNTVLSDPGNTSGLTNYISTGYQTGDINLDGNCIYAGTGNDISIIFNTVLSHPGNTLQLPNYIVTGTLP